jgi:hypothetical protein
VIHAALSGLLMYAAFMAVVVAFSGAVTGALAYSLSDPPCPDCDQPRTQDHQCKAGA